MKETAGGITTSYDYNELNQLVKSQANKADGTATSHKTFDYDRNGNQIGEKDSVTGQSKIMGYDAADRLSLYAAKDGDAVELTQENQYNGNGQRIQKKETKGQTTKANNYYYQNGTVLYTTDESDKRTSLNLMGVENNVIATARDEKWYLYNKDVRGSTSSLVNGTGEAAAAYEYDAFGNTTVRAGEGFENEICYTGQVYDTSTGLYYYNARFYDPENGRFVSQDTYRGEIKEPGTWHLYAYCANNPVNYVDSSGHKSKWVNSSTTKTFGAMPVADASWQAWRVRVTLSVNYNKAKKGKKTILNMRFNAYGDKHNNCGNVYCRIVNVKIYKGKKLWKTIKGYSKVVKRGDYITSSYTVCYVSKKITKDYAVGNKKFKVKAGYYFDPPQEAYGWGGPITTAVTFK